MADGLADGLLALGLLVILPGIFALLMLRLPAPLRDSVMGFLSAAMEWQILWPATFLAAVPVLLVVRGVSGTAAQYLFLLAYFAGTGFMLLWSGHRFQKPSSWIGDSLRSWRSSSLADGEQDSFSRHSALWTRRIGLILLALAVPVTTTFAVVEWLSA